MSEKNNREQKREDRRKRRVRNQILSFFIVLIIIAAVGFGLYKGIVMLVKIIKDEGNAAVTSVSEDETVSSDVPDAGVIATPDIDEIESVLADEQDSEDAASDENAKAREYIDSLTTEQKVASLFVVTPEAITGVDNATAALDGTKEALSEYAVGGIIYDDSNIENSDQFIEMVNNTKGFYKELYGIDVWTFVCEEGAVNTIAGNKTGVVVSGSASEIGLTGDNGNAYAAYITIGSYLKDYSIDVNIAPVCSVKSDENSFIGDRSFSQDADIAASMISKAVNGQMEQGIVTCLTAFPGEGALVSDTKDGKSATDRTLDDMRECEFKPFEAGISEGSAMVMMSHMTAENATGEDVPCSMSSVMINDVLREELGFNGIVISDALNKKAITDNYGSGEAAVIMINAGCDMILNPADFKEAYNAVLEAVNDGTISEERLDEALMNIYSYKLK